MSRIRTRPPTHPGAILKELYMMPLELSTPKLAMALGVSRQTVYDIINEQRAITPEMALRLARAFPNSTPESWLTLQKNYDLWHAIHHSQEWQKVQPIIQEAMPVVA